MDTKLVQYLSKLSLFRGAPEAVLAEIAGQINVLNLAKDDVLIREGDPSDSLFVIQTGWVKVVTEGKNDQEVVLNQCGPSQIVGEMSLVDHKPRSGTVVALSPAKILEIKYYVIMQLLNEHPLLAMSLLSDMSNRVRFANAYIGEVIEWCQHIAEGDYDFVQQQIANTQGTIVVAQSDEARASAFLSAFFKMVEDVKKREEGLKNQVQQLIIQIDEVKRQQAVQEVTESEFFQDLQAMSQELRDKRHSKPKETVDLEDDEDDKEN